MGDTWRGVETITRMGETLSVTLSSDLWQSNWDFSEKSFFTLEIMV